MRRIRPRFPLSHGIPREDARRVRSGIILVIQGGLRRRDAPPGYGPRRPSPTASSAAPAGNARRAVSRTCVSSRILAALAGEAGEPDRLLIDSRHLKAQRTTASPLKRGRLIGASAAARAG
jgi:hypothetical protein